MLAAAGLAAAVSADDARRIGHSEGTTVFSPRDPCSGTLMFNHDMSFEGAYAWRSWGAWPEYCGAWGEAYDLGACEIVCSAFWLTVDPNGWPYLDQPVSVYIWEGGITAEPGSVLMIIPGIVLENLQYWPEVGQHDVPVGAHVPGEFTIGFWGDWGEPPAPQGFFTAADEDGAGGHPWTYISPETAYPSGWQHPNVVPMFGDCRSVGIGLYYDEPQTPVEAVTWSRLKSLFR